VLEYLANNLEMCFYANSKICF